MLVYGVRSLVALDHPRIAPHLVPLRDCRAKSISAVIALSCWWRIIRAISMPFVCSRACRCADCIALFPLRLPIIFSKACRAPGLRPIVVNALPFARQTQVRQSLAICRELLANAGNVLIIFPEGTRSKTGEMQDFKAGDRRAGGRTRCSCFALLSRRRFPRLAERKTNSATAQSAVDHRRAAQLCVGAFRQDGERAIVAELHCARRTGIGANNMEAAEAHDVELGRRPALLPGVDSRGSRPKRRCFFFIAVTNIPAAGRSWWKCSALDDVAIFAWDARGHGHSAGERGAAENFGTLVKDVDAFVRHVHERHGFAVENMIVLAHSVGAVTGLGLGPRLRAADSRDDPGHAGLSRPALRSARHPVASAETKIRRARSRQELRESENADARSGAGGAIRRRSAHLSPDRGQRSDRIARCRHAIAR